MAMISIIWGALAAVGMLIASLPCFGSLNWLNIPFAGLGMLVGALAVATGKDRDKVMSIAGIILCGIAMLFGLFRLLAGGLIF